MNKTKKGGLSETVNLFPESSETVIESNSFTAEMRESIKKAITKNSKRGKKSNDTKYKFKSIYKSIRR